MKSMKTFSELLRQLAGFLDGKNSKQTLTIRKMEKLLV